METSTSIIEGLLEVALDRGPDVVVVALVGELDVASAGRVAEVLQADLGDVDRDVVFDLARLQFLDLAGVRVLGAIADVVTRSGWRCTVASASPLTEWLIAFAGSYAMFGDQLRAPARPSRRTEASG